MCLLCTPTRRDFLGGALALPLALGAPRHGVLEPVLRLTPSGQIAVTLDACPGRFDPRIATALVAHNIPATIFVTTLWMKWNREGLAYFLAHPDIFDLQNHGARHLPPVLGNKPIYNLPVAGTLDAIRAEVIEGAVAVQAATGKPPLWYRGAAGLYSPQAGYSLNADQGASLPAASVAKRIQAARDGEVIEGHINQPKRESGAGIAEGLVALQAQGIKFVWI